MGDRHRARRGYDPESTPPDRTRQLCNVWKADRTLGATVLSERIAAFGARLAGLPGLRLIQDNRSAFLVS